MAACDPDQSVEICSSPSDPVHVLAVAGGAAGLTDAELRATPVKVDDDATQVQLAELLLDTDNLALILAAIADGTLRGTVTITDGSGPVTVDGTVTANLQPVTSGGSSLYRNLDLGVTGQVVKNGVGQIYGYFIANLGNANRYIKLYDKATAPTQADTPVATYPLGAGEKANVAFPNGLAFAAGISLRATTGLADNDVGAPTANDVVVNLNYK